MRTAKTIVEAIKMFKDSGESTETIQIEGWAPICLFWDWDNHENLKVNFYIIHPWMSMEEEE